MGKLNVSREVIEVWNPDADRCGAGFCHLPDCGFGDDIHLLMHCFGAKEIHEYTDPRAFQAVTIQKCGVGLGDLLHTKGGDRIVGIVARHHVQHARGVFHGAGNRTSLVLCRA